MTLAVAFAATAVVEGGIDTWGVLYLRTQLAAGVLLGAGAYALGQAVAVSTRGVRRPAHRTPRRRRGLVLGAGHRRGRTRPRGEAPGSDRRRLGLLVAAGGISLCWPLVGRLRGARLGRPTACAAPGPVRAAGHARAGPRALVGAFTGTGYVGWVTAPADRRMVADDGSLAPELFLLAALAGATAVAVALRPRASVRGSVTIGRPRPDPGGDSHAGAPCSSTTSTNPPTSVACRPTSSRELAAEIRTQIVETVTANGGHLGSNLGVVELTLAVHRVFDSPKDVILWDTGHQAYVHKLVTGRRLAR